MKLAMFFGAFAGAAWIMGCEPQAPNYALEDDDSGAIGSAAGGAGGSSAGATTGGDAGTMVGSAGGGAAGDTAGPGGSLNSSGAAGALTDAAAGTGQDAARPEGGNAVDVTATAMFHGSPGGSAAFTQHGVDVTVTIKLTNCSMGNHPIFIYEGFSCDSTSTEGAKWDGARANLGDTAATSVVACKADKTGILTYTRSGADMASRWTVSDHSLTSDVSIHVVVVSDVNNETARQSCADFR